MPLIKLTSKDHKRWYKPWITNGILTSMRKRDKIFHKYIKTNNSPKKLILHTEYKNLRNQIVNLIKLNKQNFYKNYFTDNNSNLCKIWHGIKQIINVKNKSHTYF